MKSYLLSLALVSTALLVNPATAQSTGGASGPQSAIGSEKKSSTAGTVDATKPETKIGSSAKPAPKVKPSFDANNPGPYGAGLQKNPRKKKNVTDPSSATVPR